jgi:Tfp pilus assembly protein PilX
MTRRMRKYSDGEEGFAMIFTIFLIVVIAATSVAVFDLVASQSQPTAFAKKYVRTADAAAAGMQAALGQLRAAVLTASSNTANGDIVQLPCSDTSDSAGVTLHVGTPQAAVTVAGNTFSGTVTADSNPQDVQTYSTAVAYFATDPTPHEADPTSAWWSANAIHCSANLLDSVPSYAFLQSVGGGAQVGGLSALSGDRTEHATYQFKTTDSQVAGGRLAEFKLDGTRSMCLDAVGKNAADPNGIIPPGRQPMFEPCLAQGQAQQNWLYRNDLTIQYGGDTNQNLCIQNVSGVPLLEPCETDGTGVINPTFPYKDATQQAQEWAFNDNGQIEAPANDGTVPSGGSCIDPAGADNNTPASNNALLVIVPCTGTTTGSLAWNPDPEVGAGKAGGNTSGVPGPPTGQYVNYARFGNCLDVTGQSFSNGYLINYPCKQAPASASLTWNQIWQYAPQTSTPGYGIFYTQCPASATGTAVPGANCAGGSPGNDCITASTSSNIVFGTKCLSTPSDAELWQATGKTANYAGSYLLVNKLTGTCLAPNPDPAQLGQGWPKLVVTACDGSGVPTGGAAKNPLLLKWNAPAVEPSSQLANVQADQGSVTWG